MKQFIATSEEICLDSIFKDFNDELSARRIVDRWADEALSPMLNYVYFYTEPMEGAERHQPLDFTKIYKLEPIPKFELTSGNLTTKEKERAREKIKEKLAKKKKEQDNTFTPPEYDDVFL